ncbi:MAG: nitroreductase family protein [Cyclobacteriaceae bacterium]
MNSSKIEQSNKTAQVKHSIHPVIANRWSPRAFSDQSISKRQINTLLEAASWASSSYNEQPWRFVIGVKGEGNAWENLLSCLNEWNQRWAKTAPLLIIAFAKKKFSHNDAENKHYLFDTGQAMTTLSFQATVDGLFVHQMAGFSKTKAREIFNVPEDFDPVVAAAVGYLGDPLDLDEEFHKPEFATRTRKSIEEIAFVGDWDTPIED